MSGNSNISLITLPMEIIYPILDYLDELTIMLSLRGLCARLDAIIDSYRSYQVNSIFILKR